MKLFYGDTWMLWGLIPLFIVWVVAWAARARLTQRGRVAATSALRFSSLHNVRRTGGSTILFLRRLVTASRVLTVALLMMAMIRPQTGRKHTEVVTQGVDIMLTLDASQSMQALDLDGDRSIALRRNRLEVVKAVVDDFIKDRPNDQIGMVVFGTEAFTQCPLTMDHGIVATFLERIETGIAGEATAIGSAIGTAVKRLKDSKAKSKVIILLTDGRNTAGVISPRKAAQIAKTFGIKIYAIGAGTRGKAPFLAKGGIFGQHVQWQEVQIDEELLREMADSTGGRYFRAVDAEALEKIYETIDQLERTEIKTKSYMEYNERFSMFLFPAMGLLLLEVVLLGTRLRKIP